MSPKRARVRKPPFRRRLRQAVRSSARQSVGDIRRLVKLSNAFFGAGSQVSLLKVDVKKIVRDVNRDVMRRRKKKKKRK